MRCHLMTVLLLEANLKALGSICKIQRGKQAPDPCYFDLCSSQLKIRLHVG
jgi:hypothetical protein